MRVISRSRSRTKPREERRNELMNAAQLLFLEQGVEPTTIEQITTAAEVAKGTFYLYFGSKEEIRAALGDRFARQLLTRIETAVAENGIEDWKGKLSSWVTAGVNGYLDSIQIHDVLFYGSQSPTREGLIDNIIIDHLAGMLQAGVDAGGWLTGDARFTAIFLFSALHGVVQHACAKEKRINRNRLVRRLEQLCFRAVGLTGKAK